MIRLTAIAVVFVLASQVGWPAEFTYTPYAYGNRDYQSSLDKKNIPNITIERKCSKKKDHCETKLINHQAKVLHTFGQHDTLRSLINSRFTTASYHIFDRNYRCGDDQCNEILFYDDSGNHEVISASIDTLALASHLDLNKNILTINKKTVLLSNLHGQTSNSANTPEEFIDAHIGSSPNGDYAVIATARSGRVYIGDGFIWTPLHISLTSRADRVGVIGIYPHSSTQGVIALYRYTNAYNKGLYVISYNHETQQQYGGWLYNSELNNVGFDPEVYYEDNDTIIISTRNTSTRENVFFTLKPDDIANLPTQLTHINESGMTDENIAGFMIGTGVSQLSWRANSEVEKNDVTYTKVDYEISDALYYSVNAEAYFASYSLALNYIENRTQSLIANEIDTNQNSTSKELSKRASNYLFSTIDIPGLLSPSSTLRIQAELGETNGVARIKKQDGSQHYEDFSTDVRRIAILSIGERGMYYGGELVQYTMPSAIGFTNDSGDILYADFDPDFGFTTLRFVFGHDALAYAKRYETNYHRGYLSGGGHLGFGRADISKQVKRQALATTGKSDIETARIYGTMGFDVEIGYLWQQRFKIARGLGYSLSAGYRASFSVLGTGQSEDNTSNTDDLFLEFERDDLFHGPFIKANIIF